MKKKLKIKIIIIIIILVRNSLQILLDAEKLRLEVKVENKLHKCRERFFFQDCLDSNRTS